MRYGNQKNQDRRVARLATWPLKLGPLPNFTNHYRHDSLQAPRLASRRFRNACINARNPQMTEHPPVAATVAIVVAP